MVLFLEFSCIFLSQYFLCCLEAYMTILGCGDHLGDGEVKTGMCRILIMFLLFLV